MSEHPPVRVSLALVLIVCALGLEAKADVPAGAWTMVKYEGAASHGTATGLLLLTDGHFSLTYTMDETGQRWGRAHAGTYSINGDRLTFHVGWSMEYVAGKPSVATNPTDRDTKFTVANDTLTIAFSNGSVQTFKRAS
jgi:hypothetical protein